MKLFLLSVGSLFLSPLALADQCIIVERDQADRAVAALQSAERVQSFCAPCRETAPRSLPRGPVTLKAYGNGGLVAVVLNGAEIDLAYTYVDGRNLAQLAGCPTEDVDSELK